MIFVHEFGHFIVAKKAGVRVLEFALGFGKKLIAFRLGDTEYSIRLFPLGGYVKMVGEGEAGDPNDPGNFQNKSVSTRIAVIAAGPIMNCVLALLLLGGIGLLLGRIQPTFTNEIVQVIEDKPAKQVGLEKGDVIIAINQELILQGEQAMAIIKKSIGKPVTVLVMRKDKEHTFSIIPEKNPETGLGMIGVIFKRGKPTFANPGLQSAHQNVSSTFTIIGLMPVTVVKMLSTGEMKWKDIKEGSAGPIGIGQFIFESASIGFGHLIWVAGILNVAIGFFNLYPFPALDGARIAFLALGALLRKPLDPEKEELVHLVGFFLLILLVLVVSYQDISRLIHGKKFF